MSVQIITLVSFIFIIALIQLIFFITRFKIANPKKLIIVHGKIDPKNLESFKIYDKGGVFVWPVIQKYYTLEISSFEIKNVLTIKDNTHLNYKITYDILTNPETDKIEQIVKNFFGNSKTEIIDQIKLVIDKLIASKLNKYENIFDSKKIILKEITTEIAKYLGTIGFENPKLSNIFIEQTN